MPEERDDVQNNNDAGNTGNDADSQATDDQTNAGEVNWEKRYKDLQAKSTQDAQEKADLQRRIADYERQTAGGGDDDDELVLEDEERFVDKKTVDKMIKNAVSQAISGVRQQSANTYFRKTYPELVENENAIAGILRSPKKPLKDGATPEDRIDAAVKEFQAMTEAQIAKATEKAEAEAQEREEKKRKASGLGSSSTTSPKSDDEGISEEQELADRKARQAKRRGI